MQHLSADVGRPVRCKKHESVGDILRLSHSPQRYLRDHGIDHLFGHLSHHIRVSDTRRNRVDPDALRSQLSRQRQGKTVHRKFGCGISDSRGLPVPAHHGGCVQNHAAPRRDHMQIGRAHV